MISIGLIGCGEVAESGHLPTILHDDRFCIAAVCDIDSNRATHLAHLANGVPTYTSWRELLAHETSLDAVVLALPPEISPDVAIACLRRGLAVLDEKPFAATVADGRRLKEVVEDCRGIYQIGFVLRYADWIGKLKELVPQLGLPLQISVEIFDEQYRPDDKSHLARINGFMQNSSALTHEGSHVVDYVNIWHPAEWTRVSATARRTSSEFAGPNLWNAHIEFRGGSTLDLTIGWLLPKQQPSTVAIVGPEGRLTFECSTGVGQIELAGGEQVFHTSALIPDWKRQYDAFATAILLGESQTATVDDGLRALEITAACERSAELGCSITAADPQSTRIDPAHQAIMPNSPLQHRVEAI